MPTSHLAPSATVEPSTLLEPGFVVAGRYRVEGVLGEGGMGVVYAVRHVHTDEALALKLLHAHALRDDAAVERFRREARATARIASEHVARITDADTAPELGGALFCVMERLDGTDLERWVAERGPLSPSLAVELLRQAARALDRAHHAGIVHRDLKPENLFLTRRDDGSPLVKLLDFGIARMNEADAGAKRTQAGHVFGTPAYMAPEQAMGDVARVGPATDLWALGLVAFKLLTGEEYFTQDAAAPLLAAIVAGPLARPSSRSKELGASFDAWFFRCVCRDVDARFASAGEAVVTLADAMSVPLAPSLAPPIGAAEVTDVRMPSLPPRLRTESGGALSTSVPPEGRHRRRTWAAVAAAVALSSTVAAVVPLLLLRARHLQAPSPAARSAFVIDTPIALPPPAPSTASTPDVDAVDVPSPQAAPSSNGAPARRATTPLTSEQKRRLAALERLCLQGTFTASECRAKKLAITSQR